MEIFIQDERTTVMVNGAKVTDYVEGSPVPEKKAKHEPDRTGVQYEDALVQNRVQY